MLINVGRDTIFGNLMGDSIGMLLFKEKQLRLLSLLTRPNKEWHLSDLAKEANVTYVHTSKFIKKCEEYGIVASEKHGRVKRLYLTEKGNKIAKDIASVSERISTPEPLQQKPAPAQPPK